MDKKPKKKKPVRSRVDLPFTQNLESLLKERELSQRQLASMLEPSPATLSSWVSGNVPTDLLAVKRLCKLSGVSFEFILTGTSSDQNPTTLTEVPDSEEDSALSGIFQITARRLKSKRN